jgi:hypothetical protein
VELLSGQNVLIRPYEHGRTTTFKARTRDELSSERKRREIGFVDQHHLVDGELQSPGDVGDMVDFVETERPALATL